jgi:hypothetical protein
MSEITAQYLCPTIIAFVLAGLLKNKETAATWYNFRLYNEGQILTSFKDCGRSLTTKLILAGSP